MEQMLLYLIHYSSRYAVYLAIVICQCVPV